MIYKIEKFDKIKHKKLLKNYLEDLEKDFEYIPFIFSVEFIEILSQFKDFFVIIKNNEIINLGYKNNLRNNVGFLFEMPKEEYPFLKTARTVASLWIPKQKKVSCEKIIEFEEIIINGEKTLDLKNFSKLRKKVNKIKRDYPRLDIEIFDKKNISEKEIKLFYDEWEKITKSRKSPYMNLYYNYIKYMYENLGKLKGIVIRDNNKIIGVSFFSFSPLEKQAIGFSCNGFHTFKGLNEFLAYERYKLLWEKYKIKFVNVGPCGPGEVIEFKEKFDAFEEGFKIAIIKGANLENEYFWYNDALDPDDFNQGQYG